MDIPVPVEREFIFVCEAINAKLTAPVKIPHSTSSDEFAERLIHAHSLPCFVESGKELYTYNLIALLCP